MTSPRTPRQLLGLPVPEHIDLSAGRGGFTAECRFGNCGASSFFAHSDTSFRFRTFLRDHDHDQPLSEVLPETPEPPQEGSYFDRTSFADEEAEAARAAVAPVPASQSVPAFPVSSTGGKETGEAAETATEALNAAGVGSLSEAIGLALNDTYAGLEFEDPTFESGTMAIIAVLRERLTGWRPPLPEGGEEIGDDVIVHFEGRPVVGRPLSVKVGWEGDQFVELPRDFAVPASLTLPDNETETETCPDGECNQGMCGGMSDSSGPCGGCCGCLGGCLDARTPALSGEALRDVEERDDAAGDLP